MSNHNHYDDMTLRDIFSKTKIIAMIGASGDWKRPSYFAMKYLQKKGFKIIPVNPSRAGEEILKEKVYSNLSEIPHEFDMVDIFRNSESAPEIVEETITCKENKNIKFVWMQLGVRCDESATIAENAGLTVIMNRCPKIEYGRLSGELGWGGINSGIISSKPMRILRT